MTNISKYEYLWNDPERGEWGLEWVELLEDYVIIHIPSSSLLTIEDDKTFNEAIRRMLDVGVPIVTWPYTH